MRKGNSFRDVLSLSILAFMSLSALRPVQAQCQLKYFIAFDDSECSLLQGFKAVSFINNADNSCTPIGDGRAFLTSCDADQLTIKVFGDE